MRHAMTRSAGLACLAGLIPGLAQAHTLPTPYVLPVPFWMYLYACVATLVVTFALLGYFVGVPAVGPTFRVREVRATGLVGAVGRWGLRLLRAGTVGCLLLTVIAGLIGTGNPSRNIAVTLFWIEFLLGFTYLTALVGDVYYLINPWTVIVEWLEGLGIDLSRARFAYPERLGYYPAFLFYVALIWIELFVLPKPFVLSAVLLTYSLVTLAGAGLFGQAAWFRYGELFSVFFRLVATLAPVEYTQAPGRATWQVRLRPPFVGALKERPEHMSLVLFVLFMLSSTSYDAIHNTVLWVGLFWKPVLALSQPLWGTDIGKAQRMLMDWYLVYQRAGLVVSPFLYLGFYLPLLACAKATTRVAIPVRTLALEFGYSLIPIAFVYNMTHYYTMLITQGSNLLLLASDPFGFGWNLLGLVAQGEPAPLNMGVVWHTQVALILIGHVVSVYLAHVIAMRVFPSRRQAIVSQVPLLLLMVSYTAIGLWILSLPLAPRR